ncbi:virulence-associated E family protein [Secundilactobacillus silagei]|uniref:virulence-associated E family protein n=1 Tax=Secundilactobacillus silagei TaxID=1293415 RepID=UPI000B26F4D7|nr:virulence-associated E family protein [Secundilactobacillus silagei]
MQFDQVLDLVGGQGIGKTTLLKKMANGLYTDSFTSFTNKDDLAMMVRSWIVNDDEMTVSQRTDFASLKKFISQQRVEYRKPYGKVIEKHDKGFVIARTTNQLTYLKDRTGDRRFLPIRTNKSNQELHPFYDLKQDYIDQLWGEFTFYYKDGFDFGLSKEQEKNVGEKS